MGFIASLFAANIVCKPNAEFDRHRAPERLGSTASLAGRAGSHAGFPIKPFYLRRNFVSSSKEMLAFRSETFAFTVYSPSESSLPILRARIALPNWTFGAGGACSFHNGCFL